MADYTLLQIGAVNDSVRELQETLIAKGYSCGDYGADGVFGAETYNAVLRYQRDHGLQVDGVAGDETQTHLYTTDYEAIGKAVEATINAIRELPEYKTLEVLLYGG